MTATQARNCDWTQHMTMRSDQHDSLGEQIAAFEEMRDILESEYRGKCVVLHERTLIDSYDTFQLAAEDAITKFGRGPYLIRQVGATPARLPLYPRWTMHANAGTQQMVELHQPQVNHIGPRGKSHRANPLSPHSLE